MTPEHADDDWINPFNRDRFVPVDPLITEWARALCEDYGAKPDELIGMPEYPRWRAWVGYAENASRAAVALGFTRVEAASPSDAHVEGPGTQSKALPPQTMEADRGNA